MTLKALSEKIGEAQNKKYILASLSQKLRNETITYKEIFQKYHLHLWNYLRTLAYIYPVEFKIFFLVSIFQKA